jgi:hypothetical protein
MAKFAKELITSLTQAAKHARGGKVKGVLATTIELPDVTATANVAHRVSWTVSRRLPILPYQRTSQARISMSQMCQQETHAPQRLVALFDHLVGAGD